MTLFSNNRAFSLIEVTLALGLVAFCLVALVGLFPVGLGTVKASRDEAAAVNCLEQISGSLRDSLLDPAHPGNYQATGAYSNLAWVLGGPVVSTTMTNLSAGGFPTTSPMEQKYQARIEIHPPSSSVGQGTALISVTWPPQATWNSSDSTWKNAQGAVHTWLVFQPAP